MWRCQSDGGSSTRRHAPSFQMTIYAARARHSVYAKWADIYKKDTGLGLNFSRSIRKEIKQIKAKTVWRRVERRLVSRRAPAGSRSDLRRPASRRGATADAVRCRRRHPIPSPRSRPAGRCRSRLPQSASGSRKNGLGAAWGGMIRLAKPLRHRRCFPQSYQENFPCLPAPSTA